MTQCNGAVDWNIISPCMYLAQDRWVTPSLGTALMRRIKEGTIDNNLSADYITLRDHYVLKPVVFWTYVELIPKLVYKHDNGSIVKRVSEDTESIGESAMTAEIDRAKNSALYYTQLMVDYINANAQLFPEGNDGTLPNRPRRNDVYPGSDFYVPPGNTAMSRDNNRDSFREFLTNNTGS